MAKKKKPTKEDLIRSGLEGLDREALLKIIINQSQVVDSEKSQNEDLRNRIKELNEEIERLDDEVERLTKQLYRPAAPFRISDQKRKRQRKKPGRKKGHAGSFRPVPNRWDEQIKVALDQCPHCAGALSNVRKVEQYIEEIPPRRKRVLRLITYRGKCENCGQVESDHPLKVSGATGAAKCHLGAHAQALAVALLYEFNLTISKTARLLKTLYGLNISRAGLVHLCHKIGQRCAGHYQMLEQEAKKAPVLYADETSWYVGAPEHYLWFFGHPQLALYRIADNRRRENINHIIGKHFAGVLVSDCLSIYDGVNEVQHKCYAHHLKQISKALDSFKTRDNPFLKELQLLLKTAMILKQIKEDIPEEQYHVALNNLKRNAARLLPNTRDNPVEESIANRLRKQQDHLFTFLKYENVDATNNLAERMLRPAVISRKISCGNKTNKGARTWEILTSILNTNQLKGIDNYSFLVSAAKDPH